MANNLIFKVQPTESIDSVERDNQNYQVTSSYTTDNKFTAVIAGTTGAAVTLDLPSDSSLPSASQFIQLQSDQALSIEFNTTTGVTTQTLEDVEYLAGDFKAHSFVASNSNTEDANIIWSIYST